MQRAGYHEPVEPMMRVDHSPPYLFQPNQGQVTTRFDPHQKILWSYMDPKPRACFSYSLLEDLRKVQQYIEQTNRGGMNNGFDCPIPYAVFTSKTPKIFNFGGDLELFLRCIREQDRQELWRYASLCIDVLFSNFNSYGLPMTTFVLAKGDALGGGFEGVLSGNVIVAEKDAQFGLPEVLFNMFPGMGAYSLLSRRVGAPLAEKIILSGRIYRAAEMKEMGVVDILAENGEGETAISEYVAWHSRKRNAYQGILKVRRIINRIDREELDEIAKVWVDAALRLGPKDMKLMERLIKAQDRTREEVQSSGKLVQPGIPGASGEEIMKRHTPAS